MWPQLRQRIKPIFFFTALLSSFLTCCLLGHYCADHCPFGKFRRFHNPINQLTLFYPTVSQMVSLGRRALDNDKIVILIGGNSLAMGRDQGQDLWSDKLQTMMGPKYEVINLGLPGFPLICGPYFAFLSLTRQSDRIFFVGIHEPCYVPTAETDYDGYPYWWDAYYKQLLPDLPDIRNDIETRAQVYTEAIRTRQEEFKLASLLDSAFYFRDLWTTVGYNSFFTVWTTDTASTFLKARKDYPDIDPPQPESAVRVARIDVAAEVDRIRHNLKEIFELNAENHWVRSPQGEEYMQDMMRISVPSNLRSRVLMIAVRNCPCIQKFLTKEEQVDFERTFELNKIWWEKLGCRALDVGKNFSDEDYFDANHLSGSGGEKLAEEVAQALRELTRGVQP